MKVIRLARFAATTSDNTGNVRRARADAVEENPILLNCLDVPHHKNNTLKDIGEIEYFQSVGVLPCSLHVA